jgi:plasmid stability protein
MKLSLELRSAAVSPPLRRGRISVAIPLKSAPLRSCSGSKFTDISIKGVPEEQVRRLRERAKANHRSLQGELRALIDEATETPRPLTVDEIVARVSRSVACGGTKRRG